MRELLARNGLPPAPEQEDGFSVADNVYYTFDEVTNRADERTDGVTGELGDVGGWIAVRVTDRREEVASRIRRSPHRPVPGGSSTSPE